MKKFLFAIMSVLCLMSMLLAGCSGGDGDENNAPGGLQNQEQNGGAAAEGVDLDLTVLSSTMVYAEVYNMMTNPNDYMGKTIRISGPYYASFYDETGLYYHYVIIEDATACCQSGVEFIWNGNHNYPDDYPEDQTKIEVTGVFGSYEELNQVYYYLAVDDISIQAQ